MLSGVLVPTRRFWVVAATLIPVVALSFQAGQPLIGLAADALLVAAAAASGAFVPPADRISVRRKYDVALSVGASNRIELEIENLSAMPIRLRLRDEPPPDFGSTEREFELALAPGRKVERTYYATPPSRGSDEFRGTFVRIRCPLGLVDRQYRLPTREPLRVYPNVLRLREFDLLNQRGRLRQLGIRRTRMRGLGSEFESLREYISGDDYRKIDWKASARRDKLIVRQFETERNQAVILAVDVGRHMLGEVAGQTKLDHALDAALMLAQAASAAGDHAGLFVFGARVERYLPPRKGRNQVGLLVEALHDLVALPEESDPVGAFSFLASRWRRRSLLAVFTDSGDGDRAQALASALGPLARRHLVLVVRVRDPRMGEAIDARVTDPTSLFRKGAGLLLEEDGRQASSVLAANGLQSVEAEPQELAARLVSFYFGAKERGSI